MNITELARILKIPTKELREALPQLGFDIGMKAIKVDDRVAGRIITEWPQLKKRLAELSSAEQIKEPEAKGVTPEIKKVLIPPFITVRELAQRLEMPVTNLIQELMKNGILANLNERIDYETAAIITEDLGFSAEKVSEEARGAQKISQKIEELLHEEDKSPLEVRPPVVVIMGHIDHGKSKLLDYIRKTNIVAQEAGGITQHIGAYQVTVRSETTLTACEAGPLSRIKRETPRSAGERIITFIDTPGHEAFTTMRSRGARLADVAILVVAADDGIKPQTREAMKIIQGAHLPMIVAINKIDKPEANQEKVKQELAQDGFLPEEWGGKTICVPISAKVGTGVDDLLEMIILIADLEKEKIRANPQRRAIGTIIESHIDKGEGPVATVLVQTGSLRNNDILSINRTFYGKVRAMKDFRGQAVKIAPPSMPVRVLGFKQVPEVGDILEVVSDSKSLEKKVKSYSQTSMRPLSSVISPGQEKSEEVEKVPTLNLILKTDVLGSLEAIILSLEKLSSQEVKVNVIARGLGNVTEADVLRAEATGAEIIGFHIQAKSGVQELAKDKKVSIKFYQVIYDLINEVKAALEKKLGPRLKRSFLGKLQVLAIFRREKGTMIVGGKVIDGKVEKGAKVQVMRKGVEVTSGEIIELQSGKEEVKTVVEPHEVGMKFRGDPVVEVGDILEVYEEKESGLAG